VRDSLNEINDKKEKKETLVEELDLNNEEEEVDGEKSTTKGETKLSEPDAEDAGETVK